VEISSNRKGQVLPMNDSMLREPNDRTPLLIVWTMLICCVVIGSLLPAASSVMVAVGHMHVSDKVLHFCAYLALSSLPVIGFRDRRRGLAAGLSMFLLGLLMEAGQHFAPGRAVEFGDVIANGAGVSCGALLGLPIGTCIAIL
jgi:VanZ family protein